MTRLLCCILLGLLLSITGGERGWAAKGAPLGVIRVACPTSPTLGSQLGAIFTRTNQFERFGLRGDLSFYQYGPQLIEALVSERVDVIMTASDGNVVSIAARGMAVEVPASLGDEQSGLLVLADRGYRTAADLRGKKVAVPFGGPTHRNVLTWLSGAGLTPGKDVTVINLGVNEIAAALITGKVDAIATWSPTLERLQQEPNTKTLQVARKHTFVVFSKAYVAAHRAEAVRFLAALREALYFVARQKSMVNRWASGLSRVDPEILHLSSVLNRNYGVKRQEEISMSVTAEEERALNEFADLAFSLKLISKRPRFEEVVTRDLLRDAAVFKVADSADPIRWEISTPREGR